jgi:hypothetical protein
MQKARSLFDRRLRTVRTVNLSLLEISTQSQNWVVLSEQQLKGLILAQNERWRRGLGMQVERKGQQWYSSGVRDSNV